MRSKIAWAGLFCEECIVAEAAGLGCQHTLSGQAAWVSPTDLQTVGEEEWDSPSHLVDDDEQTALVAPTPITQENGDEALLAGGNLLFHLQVDPAYAGVDDINLLGVLLVGTSVVEFVDEHSIRSLPLCPWRPRQSRQQAATAAGNRNSGCCTRVRTCGTRNRQSRAGRGCEGGRGGERT